jgi:hypothetical protein
MDWRGRAMIFWGSFLCGDEMTIACSPTDIDNINRIELSNGIYDDLMATNDVESELTETIQKEWDHDKILHATFDGNALAGNINWTVETTSDIIIKRRKVGEFNWITLETKEVNSFDDFTIVGIDKTASPNFTYEYAIVPVLNGIEGNYSLAVPLDVKSNSLVVLDKDEMWATVITDGYCDEVSNVPNSVITTMNDIYPTVISNTSANYKTITVNCQFIPTDGEMNGEECQEASDEMNPAQITTNNEAFIRFLNNRKPKLLKNLDGRIWLVYVTTPPTNAADEHYLMRKITFGCTEIGNVMSEEDLYYAGLITAEEKWWNQ